MESESLRETGFQRMKIQLLRYWRPLRAALLRLSLVAAAICVLLGTLLFLRSPIFVSNSLLEIWHAGHADRPDSSAREIITSHKVLADAVASLDTQADPASIIETARLQVEALAGTRLVRISYASAQSEHSRDVVQAVTQSYIAMNRDAQIQLAEDAAAVLLQKLELLLQPHPWLRDGETVRPELSEFSEQEWSPAFALVQLPSAQSDIQGLMEEAVIKAAVSTYENSTADVTSIRVLENASLPLQPEARPVIMPLLSCYLLVFVAGALLILFRQWRQDRISAADEADALLGYKLLGELPQVSGQQQTAELSGLPAYAEAMRNIRTRLSIKMNAGEESGWSELARARVITVTSACQGEGKTAVATQLALSLGQFSRVLLIDTVMRKGHEAASLYASLPAKPAGLSHIIAGAAQLKDCLHRLAAEGIDVMPCGVLPPNPQELLASKRFARVLEALSRRYDYIILDSAALDNISDALLLVQHSRQVLFTLKAGATSVGKAADALNRLAEAGGQEICLILNQVQSDSAAQVQTGKAETGLYGYQKPGGSYLAGNAG